MYEPFYVLLSKSDDFMKHPVRTSFWKQSTVKRRHLNGEEVFLNKTASLFTLQRNDIYTAMP